MTSLAAWVGGEHSEDGIDLSVVLHWLVGKGDEYLQRVGRDFSAEVQRKRIKFGFRLGKWQARANQEAISEILL